MGDLGVETAVEDVGGGRYRATLHRAWEIWGPMGGYIASIALRAVGACSPGTIPASFSCLYLGVASFDEPVEIDVVVAKAGRTVAFHRATISQGGRPVLEAMVCSTGPSADGPHALVHDETAPPAVPEPLELRTIQELVPDDEPPFPFWRNFEARPVRFRADWPPAEPVEPVWQQWLRFEPTATYDDPWVDACRAVVLVDVQSWPAAHLPHAHKQLPVYAPSLDLYVAFHVAPGAGRWGGWLLADGHAPVAGGGLMGWTGRLWSEDRRLLASGGGQLLCREARTA